jgi:hypothetical protein
MHLQSFADFERAEANMLRGENTLFSQVEDKIPEVAVGGYELCINW